MALDRLIFLFLWCHLVHAVTPTLGPGGGRGIDKLLPASFPSKADTLAYVDALKHSNFSQWRSLEEVAKRAGGGSCTGALNTSVLTALYLLGLFNLCAASPASCCVPSIAENKRRKRSNSDIIKDSLPPLLNSLTQNLSSLPLEPFDDLPQVAIPQGGKVPVHISVVEQVRKLWDSNPRLLSDLPCTTATEALRSSFISLSGVASGIILAYSIAQLNQCYPDQQQEHGDMNKIWFFPIPKQPDEKTEKFVVRSLPPEIPVQGEDERDDSCERSAVQMSDGSCEKLLSSRVCPYMQWVLLNRETGKGECFPRLCSEGKVFVEHDQLCHNVNEPEFCPENQRLYLTAWGEAVCDCQDGMFFGPDKKCHRIYDQGYCYKGTVLQFHKPSKTLVCKTDHCKKLNNLLPQHELPFVKSEDNTCYQFGSTGPCEESEKLGFNIEELEPSCVSLEEAGLIRYHRSYQYSHMSFPSFPDKDFPHYEVSYVILNGSTWELMMRTVGSRHKREISKDFIFNNHTIIPFIDTRDFPNNMEDITKKIQSLQNDIMVEQNNDTTQETPLMLYERVKNQKLFLLKQESDNSLVQKDDETMQENGNFPTKSPESHQHSSKFENLKEEKNNSDIRNYSDFASRTILEHNPEVSSINEQNNNNYNNTKIYTEENGDIQNATSEKVEDNDKVDPNKVLSEKSKPCKWEISFYSQMPNTSKSFNSTSINILSHRNLAHFRIKSSDKKRKIKFEEMNSSEKPISRNQENDAEIDRLIDISNDTNYIKEENITNKNLQDIEEMSTTTKMPLTLLEHKLLAANLVKTLDSNVLDTKLFNIKSNSSNSTTMEIINDKVDLNKIGSKLSNKMKFKNRITSEEIILGEIKNVNDTKNVETKSATNFVEKNEKTIFEKESQLIKVFQPEISTTEQLPVSKKDFKKEIRKRDKKGKRRKRRKKKKRTKQNKRKRNKIKNNKTKNGNDRSNFINPNGFDSFDDYIVERISQDPNLVKNSEDEFQNPFTNQSLPDYLRNRGRRQAGTRKGLKLTSGIINAPLLNQCRPGAKRDYNGYCRPKVIPSARVPAPRKHQKSKYFEPTPPRMKCKEDKRLDSRGVCRATFSGLG